MSFELIYTSAPQGLKPGSKGYCTVGVTTGINLLWQDRLESLSGYRAYFALGDPRSGQNPVNWAHWRVAVGGKVRSVLSRIAFAGADYSQRSNKLAHHLVLEPAEQAAGGPAWMMSQNGLMRTAWDGEPRQMPSPTTLPQGSPSPRVCQAWAQAKGDGRWAAALADAFVNDSTKPAYVVYQPGMDLLNLFDESLSLLPPAQRWEVTFSTYFTELPLNLQCAWRGVIAGSPAAIEAARMGPRAVLIDLTQPAGVCPDSALAQAARKGTGPVSISPPARSVPGARLTLGAMPVAAVSDPLETSVDVPLQTTTQAEESPRQRLEAAAAETAPFIQGQPESPPISHPSARGKKKSTGGVPIWVLIASCAVCLVIGFLSDRWMQQSNPQPPDTVTAKSDTAAPVSPAIQPDTAPDAQKTPQTGDTLTPAAPLGDTPTSGPAATEPVHELVTPAPLATLPSVAGSTDAKIRQNQKPKILDKGDFALITDSDFDFIPPSAKITPSVGTPMGQSKTTGLPEGQMALSGLGSKMDQLCILWPNGKTKYQLDLAGIGVVTLTFESNKLPDRPSVHVIAEYQDKAGILEHKSLVVTIFCQTPNLTFQWNDQVAESAIQRCVSDALSKSVFVFRDAAGHALLPAYDFSQQVPDVTFDMTKSNSSQIQQLPDLPLRIESDPLKGDWQLPQSVSDASGHLKIVYRNSNKRSAFFISINKQTMDISCDWSNHFADLLKYANFINDIAHDSDPTSFALDDKEKAYETGCTKPILRFAKDSCGLGDTALDALIASLVEDHREHVDNPKEVASKFDQDRGLIVTAAQAARKIANPYAVDDDFCIYIEYLNGMVVQTIHVTHPSAHEFTRIPEPKADKDSP